MTRQRYQNTIGYVLVILTLTAAAPALAKPQLTLTITTEKQVITGSGGSAKVTFVPAKSFLPGDIVQYTLSYENKGADIALNAVIDDAIPDGVKFVGSSAEGKDATITFSNDGGKNFAEGPKLTYEMTTPDGKNVKRVASPDEYTHIRWTIKQVAPGGSGKVSFKAKVT